MRPEQKSDYNYVAIWTVAVCLGTIIGCFTLNAVAVYGSPPGLGSKDLNAVFRLMPFIAVVGFIQCFRVGGRTSAMIMFNTDGVISPTDPRVIEFEKQNKRHGGWLTAIVGVGSNIFFAIIICSTLLLLLS